MIAFVAADAALVAAQAGLVAMPRDGLPSAARRLPRGARAPLTAFVVIAIVVANAEGPAIATALSRLAFVAVPALAAGALAWAARGARPALAILVAPVLALACLRAGRLDGDAAAAVLSTLSCVTLGRLLATAVPGLWLKAGLVVWAVYDAITVFSHPFVSPDAIIDAAVPAPGLPQLQVLDLHAASLGYADIFVAGVLGGVLAAEGRRQWPVAVGLLGLSGLFDLLFFAFSTLPATVPVAAATLISEFRGTRARRGRGGGRPRCPAAGASGGCCGRASRRCPLSPTAGGRCPRSSVLPPSGRGPRALAG